MYVLGDSFLCQDPSKGDPHHSTSPWHHVWVWIWYERPYRTPAVTKAQKGLQIHQRSCLRIPYGITGGGRAARTYLKTIVRFQPLEVNERHKSIFGGSEVDWEGLGAKQNQEGATWDPLCENQPLNVRKCILLCNNLLNTRPEWGNSEQGLKRKTKWQWWWWTLGPNHLLYWTFLWFGKSGMDYFSNTSGNAMHWQT